MSYHINHFYFPYSQYMKKPVEYDGRRGRIIGMDRSTINLLFDDGGFSWINTNDTKLNMYPPVKTVDNPA